MPMFVTAVKRRLLWLAQQKHQWLLATNWVILMLTNTSQNIDGIFCQVLFPKWLKTCPFFASMYIFYIAINIFYSPHTSCRLVVDRKERFVWTTAATCWQVSRHIGDDDDELEMTAERRQQTAKITLPTDYKHQLTTTSPVTCLEFLITCPQVNFDYCLPAWRGGAVAQWVERWTCDQLVVGSNPTRGKSCVTTFDKLFTPICLRHRAV